MKQFVQLVNNTCNSRNQLIGNSIAQNRHNGINLVSGSDYNLVTFNHLFNHSMNSRGAVYIEDSRNNQLVYNNLTDNMCWGIQLKGDQGNNIFYGNDFINNSYMNTRFNPDALQVSTPGTANGNPWDNGSFGNYWSDCKGSDANSEGICDSPYYINSNNQDNYPLINQVSLPKGTSTSAPTSEPHPTEPTSNPANPELSWLVILPLLLIVFS